MSRRPQLAGDRAGPTSRTTVRPDGHLHGLSFSTLAPPASWRQAHRILAQGRSAPAAFEHFLQRGPGRAVTARQAGRRAPVSTAAAPTNSAPNQPARQRRVAALCRPLAGILVIASSSNSERPIWASLANRGTLSPVRTLPGRRRPRARRPPLGGAGLHHPRPPLRNAYAHLQHPAGRKKDCK